MSAFHGGFIVKGPDGYDNRQLVIAIADYLEEVQLPVAQPYQCSSASGRPVALATVGAVEYADDELYYWYNEHAVHGAFLARRLGATVWAYCFDRNGEFEMVARYGPDGRRVAHHGPIWEKVYDHLRLELGDRVPKRWAKTRESRPDVWC